MTRDELTQWERLSDRLALDEPLDVNERALLHALERGCPESRAEAEVYATLAKALERAPARASARDPLIQRALELEGAPPTRSLRRRGATGLAIGALFACAVLAFWVTPRPDPRDPSAKSANPGLTERPAPTARLHFSSGAVQVMGASAGAPERLPEGAIVDVGRGTACLGLPEGITACLAPHSRVVMGSLGAAQRLRLERGRVAVHVDKQRSGHSFGVEVGEQRFTAIGTAFSVESVEPGQGTLRVREGAVRAEGRGRGVTVRTQQRLDAAAREPVALSVEEARADEVLLQVERLWGERATTRLTLRVEPPTARLWLGGVLLGQGLVSVDVPRGVHELQVEDEGHQRHVRTLEIGTSPVSHGIVLEPLVRAEQRPAAPEGAPTERAVAASQGTSVAELLEAARAERANGQYGKAAQRYQELLQRYPGSAEAKGALLSLAELQLTRLGNARGALRGYESYLSAGGNLAPEAHYGKIRALRALGRTGEERAAIVEFLNRHRGSAYGPALEKRLEEL